MSKKESGHIVIFQSADGKVSVDARFDAETAWLSLDQMAALFERDKSSISRHIKNIFEEGELMPEAVVAKIATTAADGKVYQVDYYNLDVIISVGYRVKSQRGTQFRIWATKRLNEYIRKGFALDDERLKSGAGRYFRELLQRVRDIRSSERNLYQQVTDIYATAIDYDSSSETPRKFFATVQNKMHYAAHRHTAAEIIYNRVDAEKPLVGMTSFKGNYVTREDVTVAKNFLTDKEQQTLNLLVSQFLDYAELQALEEKTMTMNDWIAALDTILTGNGRVLLVGTGTVSHRQAVEKAEHEFNLYRAKEMRELESDFDRMLKELEEIKKPER